ncbi:MAG: DNA polymerase I, partial [Clostridiales bacterium]|nr:DNA polymerase I [Clostridiales bacterium]
LNIIEQDIYKIAGCEFNLNSPKQLGKVLFEDLNLPHGKKNKTGYSTSIKVLEKLAIDHDIANKIIKYRQLKKLQSTYVEGLLKRIADDGRIHSNFKQTVTATGRISSTEPNLQNLPIRSELGREIRKAFICENDQYILLGADYSQIELRILAHISNDLTLVEAFSKNEDIHTKTAAKVFGVDERMVTTNMRRTAKAVNFGIVYGISDFGLSRDLNISVVLAKQYIKQYLQEYKMVKIYMDDTVKFAEKNGYVSTIFNRKRHIKELQSPNYMQREFGKRIALNTPIQGAAADVMKIAMIKVYNQFKKDKLKSRLILQIHDELVIETHIEEVNIVEDILKKHMTNGFSLKVPLTIDISEGKSLYEAK